MNNPEASLTTNQMAADRTWMAHERTLMAWIRTATSMISFGFTIYKFFDGRTPNPHSILSSRNFAILMISFGLIALILASIQHIIQLRPLRNLVSKNWWSIALVLSILIAALGIFALVSVALRG